VFFNEPFRNEPVYCFRNVSGFELYLLGQQPPFRNSIEGVAGVGIVREIREDILTNLSLLFFLI
jgi:hypothetical protein